MRVMLSGFQHPPHIYPLVPYAQALQNAGHEVCIGVPCGGVEDVITAAGLTAVTTGRAEEMNAETWGEKEVPDLEEMDRFAEQLGFHDPITRDHWEVFYQFFLFAARFYIPPTPREDIQELVDFARTWRPDLVLWDHWFPAGAVAARVCGAAHARVLICPDYGMWADERFAELQRRASAPSPQNPYRQTVSRLADHYGLEVDDELLNGQRTIDPLMPDLRLASGGPSDIAVRWIPYSGGAAMPTWLHGRPERPRLALTVGLSARGFNLPDRRIPKILEAVSDLDVEAVATLNSDELDGIDRIPDNVRTVDYLPLAQLLPTCSAMISHGSGGTVMAPVAAGVPQLIADTDQHHRMEFHSTENGTVVKAAERSIISWVSSKFVVDREAGLRLDHQAQSVEEMRARIVEVVNEPSYREGAAALHREWLSRPSPADIVPDLEKLAAERSA